MMTMRAWRVPGLALAVLASAGMHRLLPDDEVVRYCPWASDSNGGYRGAFHVDPRSANSRPLGEWLELTFSHTPVALQGCQPMPGKTHPTTGKLDCRHRFRAPSETFDFKASVDPGQPHSVTGAIAKQASSPPEIMPIKVTPVLAPRMGATLCDKMPGVAKQPGLSGSHVRYLEVEVRGPPSAVRKATPEQGWR